MANCATNIFHAMTANSLDVVAPEKRHNTFSNVGGCYDCHFFQLLGLYLFFRPVNFLLCCLFLFLQLRYVRFQLFGQFFHITVTLTCEDMGMLPKHRFPIAARILPSLWHKCPDTI